MNIGPSVTYIKGKENLPLTLRLGAAYGFNVLDHPTTTSLDLAKTRSEKTIVGLGVESYMTERFLARLGFNSRNSAGSGVTVGVGWRVRDFELDYALVPFGSLGNAHRFSISLQWGGKRQLE